MRIIFIVLPLFLLVACCPQPDPHAAIVLSEEEAVSLAQARVVQEYHYKNFASSEPVLKRVQRPSEEYCTLRSIDYYEQPKEYASCYIATFTFKANEQAPQHIGSYEAKVFLLGTQAKSFEITEVPKE